MNNNENEKELYLIFAENLTRYMSLRNVTQIELAEEIGVSQPTVSNWCKGLKLPRMDKVDRICEILNCNRSNLVEKYDPEKERAERAHKISEAVSYICADNDDLKEIIILSKEIPAERLKILKELAKTLTKDL